jgi:hypothetical protein
VRGSPFREQIVMDRGPGRPAFNLNADRLTSKIRDAAPTLERLRLRQPDLATLARLGLAAASGQAHTVSQSAGDTSRCVGEQRHQIIHAGGLLKPTDG